jgi:hypothetical protein
VLILLAAVVVVRALLVTMLHQSAAVMAVLDLLGATAPHTQAVVADMVTFLTALVALAVAGLAVLAAQTLAVAVGRWETLTAPVVLAL